jgi:hypothetical protein
MGFDRVTRVNPIFFINQNDIILVKKNIYSQRVATGFLIGSCQVNLPGRLGF